MCARACSGQVVEPVGEAPQSPARFPWHMVPVSGGPAENRRKRLGRLGAQTTAAGGGSLPAVTSPAPPHSPPPQTH